MAGWKSSLSRLFLFIKKDNYMNKIPLKNLNFTAESSAFKGDWPAFLKASNPIYDVTLAYVGEYQQDKANGQLVKKNITIHCKPKKPMYMPVLNMFGGTVSIDISSIWPANLSPKQATLVRENLNLAIISAQKLDELIDKIFHGKG